MLDQRLDHSPTTPLSFSPSVRASISAAAMACPGWNAPFFGCDDDGDEWATLGYAADAADPLNPGDRVMVNGERDGYGIHCLRTMAPLSRHATQSSLDRALRVLLTDVALTASREALEALLPPPGVTHR